jgi:protein-tyrosine phosphatase
MNQNKKIKVLFVCLGNICRSPTAHGLFENLVKNSNMEEHIIIDSAGTGSWHVGNPPDSRAQATALDRGYDISNLRARSVTQEDFLIFDYILGMDQDNLINLKSMCPDNFMGTLGLFLEEAGIYEAQEVPDPYYGGQEHFNHVIQLIETASAGLLDRIVKENDL